MKITTKTTKQELRTFLEANLSAVKSKDKNLHGRIDYALKADDDKVTRKDLVDLAKEVIKLLGDKSVEPNTKQETPVEPKAENSVKKLNKKEVPEKSENSEKTAEKTEKKVDTKKSAKKSSTGEKPKKDGVVALEESENPKTAQMAKMFPKTFTVKNGDEVAKYELAEDIKTIDDLLEAEEENIVLAFYWTKRHLKQFPYFSAVLGQPKQFENDLDVTTPLYVSDEKKVAYTLSMYTEALYSVLPEDFEEVDGVRVSNGIEFQIYRAV